jgi:hypothetical protein
MRKIVYALTAAAAIVAGVPTLANAQDVYIHGDRGYYGDRYDGPRFRFHDRDRAFRHDFYHRDYYGDRDYGGRDVVIREHRDYW